MSFTVNDFADFMDVLRAHPEWQADLRRILVDDELAALREAVLDQQRRTDERFDQLTERMDQLTQELRTFAAATDVRFQRIENDLGRLKGMGLETWYQLRAAAVFGHVLHSLKVVFPGDLPEVRQARRDGRLDLEAWKEVRALDLVVDGLDDADERMLIAFEASWRADGGDVERARDRSSTLREIGLRCVGAVGTDSLEGELLDAARDAGVGLLQNGNVLFWPEPTAA